MEINGTLECTRPKAHRSIQLKFTGTTPSGSEVTGNGSVDADCHPQPGTPVPWHALIDTTATESQFSEGCYDDDEVSATVDTSKDPGELAEVFALMDPALC
ncbi:hypothetical protein ACWDSJ_20645 [Nocardia sp. NPDC003482]